MPLGWNEIRSRAVTFSKEWADETREHAEAKTFWDEFFRVFGLNRRHLASFEEPVKKLSGSYGFIDLFWKGMLLAEHKSAGKNLTKAESQANDYVQSLIREGRGDEVPRYLIVSDFARIALHDLETGEELSFPLGKLHENIDKFAFIPGYKQHSLEAEDPINLKAVQIMGDLHDALEDGGYQGHELERLLVRILFCLFAEDTGIFERSAFQLYLENHTQEDGSDLGATLSQFFHVLNTPTEKRQDNLREELAALPYVNGELFSEFLGFAAFNYDMRNRLIACTRFDWGRISPAVFGALFQSVMEPKERRQIGAHYTSERDIMKVIGPLFLDELRQDFAKARSNSAALGRLHDRIAAMRLLDPACGCGNFLVIAYRELRLLELDILKKLNKSSQMLLDMTQVTKVDVDQMSGIEIEEWPARIAEVAMWLMDHQMNLRFSEAFGQYFVRLPLKKSPSILIGNALTTEWEDVLSSEKCTHILGNPPFIGKKFRTDEQSADLANVWSGTKSSSKLDYVTGWYKKSCDYCKGTKITTAFVSTNSISQGEQVPIMWPVLFREGVMLHFAHRTFEWQSEARASAHVHVVIIGFGLFDRPKKILFDYETGRADPVSITAKNIAPYLIDGSNIVVTSRRTSLCTALPIVYGSMPNDAGNLVVQEEDRESLLSESPEIEQYLRPYIGSEEFINSLKRWCLWLVDANPTALRQIPALSERLKGVRKHRLDSTREATNRLASTPSLFGENRQPNTRFLLIPKNPSHRRPYLTVGFMEPHTIASDQCLIIPNATLYEFGVVSSSMHIAWVATIGGRLKSDYRYSNTVVYNNYPWPSNVTDKQREAVEIASQNILDARKKYPDSSLADLYDPLAMPSVLAKAHTKLDRAVDKCYRSQPFPNERNRVEYLFKLYEQLTAPLVAEAAKKKRPRKKSK